MKFQHQVFTAMILFLILVTIFVCKISLQTTQQENNKPLVVCTTNIIADTIAHIAHDHINLQTLMGPGVDPHLYKPIEQDVTKIAQANIIFYNGLHLEARMADLFDHMTQDKVTVAVTQSIPKHLLIPSPEHNGYFDPHVWFDPKLWSYVVIEITKILQAYDPNHAQQYEENKQVYLEQVKDMYQHTKQQLHAIKPQQRVLITGHDAFEYFAQAYGFEVIGLQGISTASEAGTRDVQNLVNFIIKNHIPAVFLETSIPPRNIQAVQEGAKSHGFHVKIGGELFSDALGSQGTPAGTYLGMMYHNTHTIAQALTSQNKKNQ